MEVTEDMKDLCSDSSVDSSCFKWRRLVRFGRRVVGVVGGVDLGVEIESILRRVSVLWVMRSSFREKCCSVSCRRRDC